MLRGRFGNTTGRPYLEGRLILPRLDVRADVSFLVDTGADRTVLMPLDGTRLGIDYDRLTAPTESIGIGGVSWDFQERALLAFAESGTQLHVYDIGIIIASVSPAIMEVPSLLGRDVLNCWRMNYNPAKNSLTFRVLSAHLTLPIE